MEKMVQKRWDKLFERNRQEKKDKKVKKRFERKNDWNNDHTLTDGIDRNK